MALPPASSSHASAVAASLARLLDKAPSVLTVLGCDARKTKTLLLKPSLCLFDAHSQRHLAHHLSSRGDARSFDSTPTGAYTSHSNGNLA